MNLASTRFPPVNEDPLVVGRKKPAGYSFRRNGTRCATVEILKPHACGMIVLPGRVDHAFAVIQKSGETNRSEGRRTEATRLAGAYRKQPNLMIGLCEFDAHGPFLVRREVGTVSLADGHCGRTVHI